MCESTCDTLLSSAANQSDNTVSVAQGGTATPGATKNILKRVYLSSKFLFKQVLLKTMEHCLLFLIFFPDTLLFFLCWDLDNKENCPISSAQAPSAILLVVIRGRVVLSWQVSSYCFKNLLLFVLKLSVGSFSVFFFFFWKKVLLIELVIFNYQKYSICWCLC